MFVKLFVNGNFFKYLRKTVCLKNLSSLAIAKQQISIAEQTINYIKTGNGEHTVLCFPGALGSIWSDFKPQVEKLDKNKFTIMAWDPPGYGLSKPPNRNFTPTFYEDDADIAYQLMKELGITKFSLLGWSDGGISSIILATKYPNAVINLVIWGANVYLAPKDMEAFAKVSDIKKWSDKMKAPLIEMYGESLFQNMWNNWGKTMNVIYKEQQGNICKERLGLIKCPTLIIHGDKDAMISPEHPVYLRENIKGARLLRFPEGKHNLHLKYADEFNTAVTNFFDEYYKAKM